MENDDEETDKISDLENVKRDRRPSNLVRLNTETNWNDTALDKLEEQLRQKISEMAVQNGHQDVAQSNSIHDTQCLGNNIDTKNEQLTQNNTNPGHVRTQKQEDVLIAPQINGKDQEIHDDYVEPTLMPQSEIFENQNNQTPQMNTNIIKKSQPQEADYIIQENNSSGKDGTLQTRENETSGLNASNKSKQNMHGGFNCCVLL